VKEVTRDPEADRDTVELIREIALKYASWAQGQIWQQHVAVESQRLFILDLFMLPYFVFFFLVLDTGTVSNELGVLAGMMFGLNVRVFMLRHNYFGLMESRKRSENEKFAHSVLQERPYEFTKKEKAILIRLSGILRARRTEKGWRALLSELEDAMKEPNLGSWRFVRAMHEHLIRAGQYTFTQ
jgi:hypothetical protein